MRLFLARYGIAFLLLWIWLLSAGTGAASTVPLSLEELVEQADLILRGEVIASENQWHDRHLMTVIELAVHHAYRGASHIEEGRVTVYVDGGFTLGNPVPVEVSWADRPELLGPGEILVFLRRSGAEGRLSVVGQGRGVFRLFQTTASAASAEKDRDSRGTHSLPGRLRQILESARAERESHR